MEGEKKEGKVHLRICESRARIQDRESVENKSKLFVG